MSLAKRCLSAFSMADDRRRGGSLRWEEIDDGRQGNKVWRGEDGHLLGWRPKIVETEHGHGV